MDIESIFNFNKNSFFILDLRLKNYNSLCRRINDLSELTRNDEEISVFDKILYEYQNSDNFIAQSNEKKILPEYQDALQKFNPGNCNLKDNFKIILDIIKSYNKKENITINSIRRKYKKKTNKVMGRSTIYYIMKNKLNFRYLKTLPKTSKLTEKSSKIRTFVFIKIIARALALKMKVIFLDESNFQLENNNLRVWRHPDETPYFKALKRGRKNIIMAITDERILLYKINKGTNNSSDFIEFMENLVEILKIDEIQNYLIVMDNCSIHLTKELLDFYKVKKLKILTIIPYFSQLNSVELMFNFIKQKLYKKVFSSFNKLIPFVEEILKDEQIGSILNKIFIKTIGVYRKFLENNNNINLSKVPAENKKENDIILENNFE